MDNPEHNPALDDTPLSVFEGIISNLARSEAKTVIPLHQGKTVFTTPVPLRTWEREEFDFPPYHDGPTSGADSLVEAILYKLTMQRREELDAKRILVTSGITHALAIVFHCILQPGDEVIILSPQWLFTNGLVRAAGGVPVEVPVFPINRGNLIGDVDKLILPHLTPRTRALYFNTPNNPTGHSLSRLQLASLVNLARDHKLWLISDNAYELYDYSREGFVDATSLPGGDTVAFSSFSFSKSYGLTGYRIGYLVSPPSMAERARKFGLYSIYSVPTCCQFIALAALRAGSKATQDNSRFIKRALDLTVQHLEVPATVPSGGFYTFLDLSRWELGVDHFIKQCIARGVSLAPGYAFGQHCSRHARLCFSVVDHATLVEGIQTINEVYRKGPSSSVNGSIP